MSKRATSRENYQDIRVLEMAEERLMLEEFLIKKIDLTVRNASGENALYWAIHYRNHHNVKILLKYNIDLMVTPKKHAIFQTIEVKDVELFMHIFTLAHVNVNLKDAMGKTLLMRAIEANDINIVRYLLNRGADLYIRDEQNHSALEYIKKCKHQDLYNLVYYRIVYEKNKVA